MSIDDLNPYEELGLNVDATTQDIRNAYKKLALRYHPDKPEGNDIKFKRINEAYQILNDPFKKQVYDAKHSDSTTEQNSKILEVFMSSFVTVLHEKLKEKLNSKIDTTNDAHVARDHSPTSRVLKIELEVDIHDVFNSAVKKVIIKVRNKGKRTLKPFYISLNNYQDTYCFEGEGDEGGDIEIRINLISKVLPDVKQDVLMSKYNLYMETHMSLYELYFGLKRRIPFYDGDIVIDVPCFNKEETSGIQGEYNYVHIVRDKGLPYINDNEEQAHGDLYIHFTLQLPALAKENIIVYEPMLKTLFQDKNE
jgi:DnaJ-class molecular chaperone